MVSFLVKNFVNKWVNDYVKEHGHVPLLVGGYYLYKGRKYVLASADKDHEKVYIVDTVDDLDETEVNKKDLKLDLDSFA